MTKPDPGPPFLGLDLGTSTCLACVVHEGKPLFVRPDLAYARVKLDRPQFPGEVMPSAFWSEGGETLVGHRALEKLTDPGSARNVVLAVKRAMHKDGSDAGLIPLGGRKLRPSQVTGEYVKVLVRAAEIELDLKPGAIKKAVVTVPAGFGEKAQKATERACVDFGGLREVQLVDEPVAAAYSLGLNDQPGRLRVLIVDLGGGTFDVTLWDVGRGIGPLGFVELGRGGDNWLGGLNWDHEIADYVLRAVRPTLPDDLRRRFLDEPYDCGHTSLFRESEGAKLLASTRMKGMADPALPIDPRRVGTLAVSFRPTTDVGVDDLSADVPGETFLAISDRLLNRCDKVCERLFQDVRSSHGWAKFGWADVDRVYLAGGGSRLPAVRRRFAERWGKAPLLDDDPQHAVVRGAAMLAELWRQGASLPGVIGRTRAAKSLGVLVWPDGRGGAPRFYPVFPRNKELPAELAQDFPIHGSDVRRLEITFAEQDDHHDGPDYDELATLSLENLPPSPGPSARETARVTVRCGLNQSPAFRVDFRGATMSGDLNAATAPGLRGNSNGYADANGRSAPPPNGSAR